MVAKDQPERYYGLPLWEWKVVVGTRDALAVGWTAGGVQELADSAARDLGCPVGIDDPALTALAYSAQPDDVDEVRRTSVLTRKTSPAVAAWLFSQGCKSGDSLTRIPANPGLGLRARVCIPLRCENDLLGFLWLLDEPERLTDEQLALASVHGVEIAAALEEQRRDERRRRAAESALVNGLIAGAAHADLSDGLLAVTGSYTVIVARVSVSPATPEDLVGALADALERLRRSVPPHHALASVAAGEVVVVLATDEKVEEPKARAAMLAELIADRIGPAAGTGICVGVSDPRADAHALDGAYREAVWATECASDEERVVRWQELGAYRTLLPLIGERPAEMLLPDHFTRLLAAKDAGTLLATLETYLEHAGDSRRAATALSLHRSSLWQRLHRIEELAGVDLRSGDARLELHLGLRLWRLRAATERRAGCSR